VTAGIDDFGCGRWIDGARRGDRFDAITCDDDIAVEPRIASSVDDFCTSDEDIGHEAISSLLDCGTRGRSSREGSYAGMEPDETDLVSSSRFSPVPTAWREVLRFHRFHFAK
jgi:hypothetical protein